MRAVAYLRVSTDRQDLGPEAQRSSIEDWARREGAEIVAWHTDHGVSGAAPVDKRPALIAALNSMQAAEAVVLVAAKRDRVARDVVAAATIERLVAKGGGRVVTADGAGSGDGPEAQLMRTLLDAFAQYERALIAARTRAALKVKKRNGERVGGVPYGFRLAADGKRIEPDDNEVRVIERVVELRDRGLSIAGIADALETKGVPSRGRRWHATTVRRILQRAQSDYPALQRPQDEDRRAEKTT